MGKKEEAREERKLKFIASLKRRQTRTLIEPLAKKIEAFMDGKLSPEDLFKTVQYVAVQSEKVTKRYRNRPDVVLAEIAMDENKFTTEINDIGIKARLGDITTIFADAIVNPADPRGTMAEGVSAAIKTEGGDEIEKEAVAKAPLTVGAAVATTAGRLQNLYVIHVAVAGEPGGPSSRENVRLAAAAVLALAEELKVESVAIPGLGTSAGKVSPEDSASAILEAIKAHGAKSLTDITLVDRDETTVAAFAAVLEKFDEENG
ncbi:MAG: macro domain-containing protein [Candidatus Krumholzibacteriaceae bacterium]|jgi:O-acetyl-ADP-ribose deacetylase (regulator of RNase III)